ncbi:MaoC family dehydratase [Orrella sp. 11846]|uniref:MaoC family dehydratase n=1 Tax=Orrella sp. 11846 TaxID=3409913 RepID=UPI003B5C4B9C
MKKIQTLQTVSFLVTEEAVRSYAELTDDFNPIHLDADFAATTPMERPIAHGTMSLCLIWKCLQKNFGDSVFADLQLDARFVKPVFIGEKLITGGQADPDESTRYHVWVRNDDGEECIAAIVTRG